MNLCLPASAHWHFPQKRCAHLPSPWPGGAAGWSVVPSQVPKGAGSIPGQGAFERQPINVYLSVSLSPTLPPPHPPLKEKKNSAYLPFQLTVIPLLT